eukprot:CAMPEP_0202462174 /NCGR_PEP_ID=MMETSP1360-20130828/52847_1 /ASSEMBLY_ACC=CAM_ASM_000848 /TAXON_ID=515479 /ORGANISM="Licmophora paradoxa, Strain CCMP2313" /LENGTH=363 /DNA_ID=CAMNT_0049084523 /DNA_START=14 /DNA_END=1105 /DNA_ORIENTATION=-
MTNPTTAAESKRAKRKQSLERKRLREEMRRTFLNEAYQNLETTVHRIDPSVRTAQPPVPHRQRQEPPRLFLTTIPNRPALINHAASLIETMHRDQQLLRQNIDRVLQEQGHDGSGDDNSVSQPTEENSQEHSYNQGDEQEEQARNTTENTQDGPQDHQHQHPEKASPIGSTIIMNTANVPVQALSSSVQRSPVQIPINQQSIAQHHLAIQELAALHNTQSHLQRNLNHQQGTENLALLQYYNQVQNTALLRNMAAARMNQSLALSSNPLMSLGMLNQANLITGSPQVNLQSILIQLAARNNLASLSTLGSEVNLSSLLAGGQPSLDFSTTTQPGLNNLSLPSSLFNQTTPNDDQQDGERKPSS